MATTQLPQLENATAQEVTQRFSYKCRWVMIVKVLHHKGEIGYHFRITNPCVKGSYMYSIPFTTEGDCEKASKLVIRQGQI